MGLRAKFTFMDSPLRETFTSISKNQTLRIGELFAQKVLIPSMEAGEAAKRVGLAGKPESGKSTLAAGILQPVIAAGQARLIKQADGQETQFGFPTGRIKPQRIWEHAEHGLIRLFDARVQGAAFESAADPEFRDKNPHGLDILEHPHRHKPGARRMMGLIAPAAADCDYIFDLKMQRSWDWDEPPKVHMKFMFPQAEQDNLAILEFIEEARRITESGQPDVAANFELHPELRTDFY